MLTGELLMALLSRYRLGLVLFVTVISIVLLVAVATSIIELNSKNYYKGIMIENLDISRLDREEAKKRAVEYINDEFVNQTITLKYNDLQWIFSLSDIDYSFNIEETLNEAYGLGRNGSIFQRLSNIINIRREKRQLLIKTNYNSNKIRKFLEGVKKSIDCEPKNAIINYKDGNISFEMEKKGQKLDIEDNLLKLEKKFDKKEFEPFELNVESIEPVISYNDIKEINGELSVFSTRFDSSKENRSYNIALACSKINNTLLMPGNEFSMDKTLESRTLANGYKKAPVIINGEFVDGIGGGICQVTTTLYNAVLLSRLKVVDRTHHSWPLGYVSAGRDATISEGSIDFKFKNDRNYPIVLFASVSGNNITINILGRKQDSQKVVLHTEILDVYEPQGSDIIIDNSVPVGEIIVDKKGRNGIKVLVYRDILDENGTLLKREKISLDKYNPIKPVIRVNEKHDKTPETSLTIDNQ